MLRIYNIPVSLDKNDCDLKLIASDYLRVSKERIKKAKLFKKSIDARKKNNVHFIYCIDIEVDDENKIINNSKVKVERILPKIMNNIKHIKLDKRPVVIGFGPAGIFAALTLARSGQNPIIVERGKDIDNRTNDVNKFWNFGELDENSNVQFGEGGAGTFSDGKLNTGTKDSRVRNVLEEFVRAGAPEEILYSSKPHIGTDKLKDVIKNIRKEIISLGGEILFNATLKKLIIENENIKGVMISKEKEDIEIITDNVILAIGHSARDTFEMLYNQNIEMEPKNFSIGVRIEHLQEMMNKSQYGKFYNHPNLGAADYKLAVHLNNGRSVYTFCMCPGGEVVASSSEKESIVTNGMSEFARNKINANSAILVGISPADFGSNHPLAGVEFQRMYERRAFKISGRCYYAPVQRVEDFLEDKITKKLGDIVPSYRPGYKFCNFSDLFPNYIIDSLKHGIIEMNNKLEGFSYPDAVLTGPETRSSSPVRILRDKNCESISFKGLYPCGEGAGYAGGIVSAAVDGIRCAESLIHGVCY